MKNANQKDFAKQIGNRAFTTDITWTYGENETWSKKITGTKYIRVCTDNEGEDKGFSTEVHVFELNQKTQRPAGNIFSVKFSFGTPIDVIVTFLANLSI